MAAADSISSNSLYKVRQQNNLKSVVNIVEDAFFKNSNLSSDRSSVAKMEHSQVLKLYNIAKKNKIGLLFLQSLVKINTDSKQIDEKIMGELRKEMTAYSHIRETMLRAASILNAANCRYVFVKSKYPFPVVPNDVDVLVFGGKEEYKRISRRMEQNGFIPLEKGAHLECCYHDSLRGIHADRKVKDPFDVDLYREVGAGHVIYMHKEKLSPYIYEDNLNGVQIPVLDSPLEIALSLFHSIFPERIFTLLLYFHIIYAFRQMTKSDISLFLKVCNEHKMNKAALIVFGIVEQIQQLCNRDTDNSISSLRESFGHTPKVELTTLPYIYPIRTIMDVFWAKKSDMVFSGSLARQAVSMLSPKYAKYVLNVNRQRSKRETY